MLNHSKRWMLALLACTALLAAACATDTGDGADAGGEPTVEAVRIGAIPDQEPERLQRLYGGLAEYLEAEIGVPVEFVPVTDYQGAVRAFDVGDLDLVWFGGLTGVQARLLVDGAEAILQREQDEQFHSVFIANTDADLGEVADVAGLAVLAGRSFTFGSESSTSGRLMPQHFLSQAGVAPEDFKGEPGFSGSHDTTIALVEAGSFEAGALNEAVWDARLEEGAFDDGKVVQIFRTPAYYDYHWVARPELLARDGGDLIDKIEEAFLNLDPSDPEQAEILELFPAERFIETDNDNYAVIEEIGREAGLIDE